MFKRLAAALFMHRAALFWAGAVLAVLVLLWLGTTFALWKRQTPTSASSDVVPGKYIIWIEKDGQNAALFGATARPYRGDFTLREQFVLRQQIIDLVVKGDGKVGFKFDRVLRGLSARMSPLLAKAIDGKEVRGGVRVRVEPVHRVHLATTQTKPPYGLDRISERGGCLNGEYTYILTGKGVHVYVIDTGIFAGHPEFVTAPGQNRVAAPVFNPFPDGQQDDHGHGTHVAGTIGGKTYGVAKEVTLHPVRVFKRGVESDTELVIEGIDRATKHATNNAYVPFAVVNMSLASPYDQALNESVRASIANGLTYVVAAGNLDAQHSDRDACHASPASTLAAITVGASHPGDDSIAGFSFVGTCLDLFAPGVYILSARNDLSGNAVFRHGTSMAAAHVSGIAALYLESRIGKTPKPNPMSVWQAVLGAASRHPDTAAWAGIRGNLWNSPNRLSHWGSASLNGQSDGEICTP